jgi:outer membrane lipoprotein LolB
MKLFISLWLLVSALLLSACATPFVSKEAALLFAAEGRLSLVARQGLAEPKQISGRFVWTETERRSQVDWLGPLGEIVARLKVGAYMSELQSKQGIETATTPEQLLQKYFGAPLPVAGLRYWLRGQDKNGHRRAPQSFDEDGWRMEYTQMFPDASQLPRIIRLERLPGNEGATVEIRLVIDQWRP